jgi:acyl-CoA reductase-like NAD-dependent aldehyde dehydrogenase
LRETVTKKDEKEIHRVYYEPLGTAAVILPWNFPFDIFIWGVMTNLIAGNTVVAKHSEHCPLTGKLLEACMREAKLPDGIFSEVYGAGETGSMLVHQDVDLIWFTGSSETGRKLFELGGKRMIKVLLEMGGSNATIVFEDVNIPEFENVISRKRFMNAGQSCSALKRLLVHESLFEPMIEAMKRICESQVVGDPEHESTTMGPLVSERQAEMLSAQVDDAVAKGATVVTGGGFVPGKAKTFYRPTVLTNISPNMRVWHEEVFGPVLPIVSFKNEAEAVKLAEDSIYGLGAQIYSKDLDRAMRVASQIRVGNIEINGVSRRIPCNPFGGCKASGIGREHGIYGFQEVSELKQISMPNYR